MSIGRTLTGTFAFVWIGAGTEQASSVGHAAGAEGVLRCILTMTFIIDNNHVNIRAGYRGYLVLCTTDRFIAYKSTSLSIALASKKNIISLRAPLNMTASGSDELSR